MDWLVQLTSGWDWWIVLGGFVVGIIVGLTGMGGGALMTPMLTLLFGVPPLQAISSDLVAAFVMKPVGAGVHIRRGTVNWPVIGWLCMGSMPTAFLGVFLIKSLGDPETIAAVLKYGIGVALLVAVFGLVYRSYQGMSARALRYQGITASDRSQEPLIVRPMPTLLVGALGGLIVGVTSVGSGSIIIIALIALYPMLRANTLVGTDLVQAVPLVGSAAVAHMLFGDFNMDLTMALLIGSIPGVYIGARFSAVAPAGLIRRALAVILVVSALKLLGAGNVTILVVFVLLVFAAPLVWGRLRERKGLERRGLWRELLSRNPDLDVTGR